MRRKSSAAVHGVAARCGENRSGALDGEQMPIVDEGAGQDNVIVGAGSLRTRIQAPDGAAASRHRHDREETEPTGGLEPPTCCLRNSCSAD